MYSAIHAYGLSSCVLSFSSRLRFSPSFVPMFVSLGFSPYTFSNFSAISKVLILSPRTCLGVSTRHDHVVTQGLGSFKEKKEKKQSQGGTYMGDPRWPGGPRPPRR